jgi:hypothetical protein
VRLGQWVVFVDAGRANRSGTSALIVAVACGGLCGGVVGVAGVGCGGSGVGECAVSPGAVGA